MKEWGLLRHTHTGRPARGGNPHAHHRSAAPLRRQAVAAPSPAPLPRGRTQNTLSSTLPVVALPRRPPRSLASTAAPSTAWPHALLSGIFACLKVSTSSATDSEDRPPALRCQTASNLGRSPQVGESARFAVPVPTQERRPQGSSRPRHLPLSSRDSRNHRCSSR